MNLTLETLNLICYVWLGVAIVIHVAMFFVTAPFGRHSTATWGPVINNKLAWVVMELPSFLIMAYFLFQGTYSFSSYVWVLFGFWIIHYFNRSFVYPLRIRSNPKGMPLLISLSGLFFNLVNAGINGYFLAELANPADYSAAWLSSPGFWIGALLFVAGLAINWVSDGILIGLRKPGETGYKIPQGFLFNYVASPNLFGEIIEWLGFFIMAWNLPALCFAVWTFANLVPRAKNHYDWYKKNFPDFPKDRKAVFPYLF